jgi:hypothetical protein
VRRVSRLRGEGAFFGRHPSIVMRSSCLEGQRFMTATADSNRPRRTTTTGIYNRTFALVADVGRRPATSWPSLGVKGSAGAADVGARPAGPRNLYSHEVKHRPQPSPSCTCPAMPPGLAGCLQQPRRPQFGTKRSRGSSAPEAPLDRANRRSQG